MVGCVQATAEINRQVKGECSPKAHMESFVLMSTDFMLQCCS
jgi:hypothetical protein